MSSEPTTLSESFENRSTVNRSDNMSGPARIRTANTCAKEGRSSGTSASSNIPSSIHSVFQEVYGRELVLVERPYGDRWMDAAEAEAMQ